MLRPPSRPANPRRVSGASEGQRCDALRPAGSKRCRAGAERRARGEHVIDQEGPIRRLAHHSNPWRIAEALGPRPADLAPPLRATQALRKGEARLGRQPRGDLLRRVESSPAPAPRRRRHRDDHADEQLGWRARRDRAGRLMCERRSTTELERCHQCPRGPVVRRRRPGAVEPGDYGHPRPKPAQPELAALAELRPRGAAPSAQRAARRRDQSEQLGEHRTNHRVER